MNFNRKGWFARYVAFRQEHPFPHELPSQGVRLLHDTTIHHEVDQAIYYFLQPTGLLYGFPLAGPFPEQAYPQESYLDAGGRVTLNYLESLFACMVADRHYLLQGLSEEEEHFPHAVALAMEFFVAGPSPAPARWPLSWLRRPGLDPQRLFESALRRRLLRSPEFLPLTGHFYNSFLFLELYFCLLWQRRMLVDPDARREHLDELGRQQRELRELILHAAIGAALVDGRLQAKERRVFEWFLRSSGLPRATLRGLQRALKRGDSWEVPEPPALPWLLRRFVLELMLMVLLVERSLDAKATEYMRVIVDRLGLWEEELNQSITALEVFLLRQGDKVPVLSERSALLNVGDALREQATIAVRKNMGSLVREIRETQELYVLLMKAAQHPLSREEKLKVRQQLMDIVKAIPALAIFALPGGGFILPVVIKLLPFNILPSAFDD